MAERGRSYGLHVRPQLHGCGKTGDELVFKEYIRKYGDAFPADDDLNGLLVGLGKVAALHVSAGHQGQQLSAAHCGGTAVKPGAHSHRQTHEHQHIHAGGGLHYFQQGLLGSVQKDAVPD